MTCIAWGFSWAAEAKTTVRFLLQLHVIMINPHIAQLLLASQPVRTQRTTQFALSAGLISMFTGPPALPERRVALVS